MALRTVIIRVFDLLVINETTICTQVGDASSKVNTTLRPYKPQELNYWLWTVAVDNWTYRRESRGQFCRAKAPVKYLGRM